MSSLCFGWELLLVKSSAPPPKEPTALRQPSGSLLSLTVFFQVQCAPAVDSACSAWPPPVQPSSQAGRARRPRGSP